LKNRLKPFSDLNNFLGTGETRGWGEINMTAAFIVGDGKHTSTKDNTRYQKPLASQKYK